MTDAAQVGPIIDNTRRELGISKAELADKALIPRSSLIRKLAAGTDFTVYELIRIADALGVDVATLFPGRAA